MLRLIALGLVLFAVGCAKKEEEDELDPPTSLFTTEDLEMGRTSIDDSEYLGYQINSEDTFYATAPEYEAQADTFDSCITGKFDAVKVSADTVNVLIKADIDFTDCPAPDGGQNSTITLIKAGARIRFWFGCPDGDVEGFDGKTIAELDEMEDSCGEKIDHEMMSNLEFTYEYTQAGEYQDGTAYSQTVESKTINANQTATGKPCSVSHGSGLYTYSDKCENVSVSTYTSAMEGSSSSYSSEDYFKVAYRSLTKADAADPLWYSSGSFETTLNNWTGSITYSAADVAPTYSLTDGTTTVEGTVGAQGSALRGAKMGGITTEIRNSIAKASQLRIVTK